MLNSIIKFFLEQKLVTTLLLLLIVAWGIMVAPFNWNVNFLPRDPVPVDAIPDIGENQQIIFTEWMGRSPQDVEDQITYPLDDIAFRYARGEDHSLHFHVRLFKHLCHF
jgi:copper/silver efflux system protein